MRNDDHLELAKKNLWGCREVIYFLLEINFRGRLEKRWVQTSETAGERNKWDRVANCVQLPVKKAGSNLILNQKSVRTPTLNQGQNSDTSDFCVNTLP